MPKLIYRILNNRVYIGESVHKGNVYPGEHDAIIDQEEWDRVHSILAVNAPKRANRSRAQTAASLKGILKCGPCGRAMKPSHTRKSGRLYRYYTCQNALKNGHSICPVTTVAAREIEGIVLGQLQALIQTPEMVARTWKAAKTEEDGITEREITQSLQSLEPVWGELFPGEQHRLVELLVDRVIVNQNEIEVHLRGEGLDDLAKDLGNMNREKMI